MRLFQGLFGRKGVTSASNNHLSAIETPEKDEWELLPGYIPVESDDPTLVSLIATAIAAGDRPNSQFKVKKIWQRNPELLTVSLIATSIASIDKPDRQLVVKSVYRKKMKFWENNKMLRKFKITIDGKEYMVEMEEIGGAVTPAPVAPSPSPAAPVESATPVAEEKVAPVATPVAPAGADAMASPMPGTILKILVKVGDTVSENQPLMILEAMKMENEIVASQAGTVSAIHVSQGQSVNAGDGLITIN